MNDSPKPSGPPPVPPPVPQHVPYATPVQLAGEPYTQYDRVADTVGMVPNLKLKDNLYQLAAGMVGAVLAVVAARYFEVDSGFLVACAIAGLIAGIVIWGVVLGVLGLRRATTTPRR